MEETRIKKKVAVFVNGWNAENVYRYLTGLTKFTPECSIDYYVFVCHSTYSLPETEIRSMATIFDLPDLRTFDAAIMFTPGLNFTDIINQLIVKLEKSGIPVISIGLQHSGFYYIGINNYTGMRQLCDHLIEQHNVRDVMFIAGPRENEDSNSRLYALRDSLRAHDIPFSESNIFYSDWEVGRIMFELGAQIRRGDKLPDAFICANDLLAETVSYTLTDNGLPVDSAIVTGFDFMDEGQNFYPSIASVDQRYEIVAEYSVNLLNRIFNGEEAPEEQLVDCEFHPGESCGCTECRNDDIRRRTVVRNVPRNYMMSDIVERRFHAMEKEIIQSVDYEDLKEKLHKLFCLPGGGMALEGNTFFIMLDPHIVDFSLSDIETYPQYHYADVMDTFVAKRDGQPITAGVIPTSQLLPDSVREGKNHIYFFVPTYYDSYVCGYIVLTDCVSWLPDKFFYMCESRFNRALVSYRRNMQLTALNTKLSMLMEKDSLTFVKNRTAYDRYTKKTETQMLSGDFEPFAVVCFDINNLKPVNDELGHEAGDEYIKKCCKLICNTFKHSPVFRIGGDEFVAIAVHDDYLHRYEYLNAMREKMDELRNDTSISPIDRISVASGMADCNEHVGDDYSAIFRRADTRMYDNKRLMKADMR
ncbi:MAG: diguanylate cyclase [Lachnospiraceae bacterium]|nr:diguanylate cyclase [Lachnospiraceae bacterium]